MKYLLIISFLVIFIAIVNANILFNLDNNNNPQNFSGKVVLTTGSSSGIGAGIAKLFAQLGANVVITGRNQTEIQLVANECQQLSPKKLKPLQVRADVSNSTELQSILDQTIKTYGQLDVLVNNAELSHLSVPYLNKTNGTIISISSIVSTVPMKSNLPYCVSKSAIDMMTRVLALELGPNIRVNTINPGLIDTPIISGDPIVIDQFKKLIVSHTPLHRIGQPLDIARGVVWLASRSASFITGTNLVIDGGVIYSFGANANILFNLDNVNKNNNNVLNDSRNFTGKVVLTTGSSSGIGAGIAKLFARLGANVVITGRNQTEIQLVANECQQLSPKKTKVRADVSNSTELQSLLDQTIKRYGRLDVLVNNAGIGTGANITDDKFMSVFDKILSVNLRPYVELSHLSVPYLNKTNGTIISISSIASTVPLKSNLSYSVSKTAIDMMTRVLALELGPNIRVNTINPGLIDTPILSGDPKIVDEFKKLVISRTPLHRLGQPLDIADGVVWLASRSASFITGINLVIDGGVAYNFGGINRF
ncbi:uncharacterized short-chain type dehydrogenase/reductase y4vI-like [Oppia nitens]|uniref:uncharacterized short-chain type dehydrogenase/reductase y4vI-like n=1 Tax=Oppia nitens TaxID=1686743 RepID=UPI0023DBC9F0|nr:uncharacterized short-chain type dehydrogenase/reductase y4vI-like [Oppia nitens]